MSENLVTALLALSPSEFEKLAEEVRRHYPRKKPGPVAWSRAQVHRVTRAVLREMMTVNGKPFDNWRCG